jgi:hypothetical protein
MHGGRDLVALANYLIAHQARRPPDHLLVEWFVGETEESANYKAGRVHAAFRFNLLNHLGAQSTLRGGVMPHMLSCWQKLAVPIIFRVEQFNQSCLVEHPRENLSPCLSNGCEPWVPNLV